MLTIQRFIFTPMPPTSPDPVSTGQDSSMIGRVGTVADQSREDSAVEVARQFSHREYTVGVYGVVALMNEAATNDADTTSDFVVKARAAVRLWTTRPGGTRGVHWALRIVCGSALEALQSSGQTWSTSEQPQPWLSRDARMLVDQARRGSADEFATQLGDYLSPKQSHYLAATELMIYLVRQVSLDKGFLFAVQTRLRQREVEIFGESDQRPI
jgi:hypothetical protein